MKKEKDVKRIAIDKMKDLVGQRGGPSTLPPKAEIEEKTDWQENLRQNSLWQPLEYQGLNTGAYWQ